MGAGADFTPGAAVAAGCKVAAGAGVDRSGAGEVAGPLDGGETLEAGGMAVAGLAGAIGAGLDFAVSGMGETGVGAGREPGVATGAGRDRSAAAAPAAITTGAAREAVLALAELGAGSGVEVVTGADAVLARGVEGVREAGTSAARGAGAPFSGDDGCAEKAGSDLTGPEGRSGGTAGGAFWATTGAGEETGTLEVGRAGDEVDKAPESGALSAVVFALAEVVGTAGGVCEGVVGEVVAAGRMSLESREVAGGLGAAKDGDATPGVEDPVSGRASRAISGCPTRRSYAGRPGRNRSGGQGSLRHDGCSRSGCFRGQAGALYFRCRRSGLSQGGRNARLHGRHSLGFRLGAGGRRYCHGRGNRYLARRRLRCDGSRGGGARRFG